MIHVLATIEVAEGKQAEFLQAFQANVPNVRAEEGCIAYEPAIDLDTDIAAQVPPRPNVVVVVEQWESLAALKAHLAAPHMQSFRETVKEIVSSVKLQILQPAK